MASNPEMPRTRRDFFWKALVMGASHFRWAVGGIGFVLGATAIGIVGWALERPRLGVELAALVFIVVLSEGAFRLESEARKQVAQVRSDLGTLTEDVAHAFKTTYAVQATPSGPRGELGSFTVAITFHNSTSRALKYRVEAMRVANDSLANDLANATLYSTGHFVQPDARDTFRLRVDGVAAAAMPTWVDVSFTFAYGLPSGDFLWRETHAVRVENFPDDTRGEVWPIDELRLRDVEIEAVGSDAV